MLSKIIGGKFAAYIKNILNINSDMKHNFCAGPAVLPQEVVEKSADSVHDFLGTGISLLSISHRSNEFKPIVDEAVALVKEVLDVPEGFSVVFLSGGASMEFCRVPYNFLQNRAAYLNTGIWAKKAQKEAEIFGEIVEVASSADKNYSYIPKNFIVPADVDYFHYTTNNTIYGTEIRKDIDSPVKLISDMSSDIFSRPVDVSKYDCIYGGAQKNLAPSGMAFLIIRDEALGKVTRHIPSILDYRVHIEQGSMFNTPPTFTIYSALMSLRWLKKQGGVTEMAKRALTRADMLYSEIDRNRMFVGTAAQEDRSYMNICWVMAEEYKELENDFLKLSIAKGIEGIKGHRSVGGFRASCYNALSLESVKVLVDCMREFEEKY